MATHSTGHIDDAALMVRPTAEFSHTPAGYARPAMPPGSHPLAWPAG